MSGASSAQSAASPRSGASTSSSTTAGGGGGGGGAALGHALPLKTLGSDDGGANAWLRRASANPFYERARRAWSNAISVLARHSMPLVLSAFAKIMGLTSQNELETASLMLGLEVKLFLPCFFLKKKIIHYSQTLFFPFLKKIYR